MGSRLLSSEGRAEFARLDAELRAAEVERTAAMSVGERLERGLELSRAACAVRDAFAETSCAGVSRP